VLLDAAAALPWVSQPNHGFGSSVLGARLTHLTSYWNLAIGLPRSKVDGNRTRRFQNYGNRVLVWLPSSLDEERFHQYSTHINSSNGPRGEMTVPIPVVRDTAIECHIWKMTRVATEELPAIPTDLLPELHKDSPQGLDINLTQIALGESTMIGLTNGGLPSPRR
jgi:hypothetical protein